MVYFQLYSYIVKKEPATTLLLSRDPWKLMSLFYHLRIQNGLFILWSISFISCFCDMRHSKQSMTISEFAQRHSWLMQFRGNSACPTGVDHHWQKTSRVGFYGTWLGAWGCCEKLGRLKPGGLDKMARASPSDWHILWTCESGRRIDFSNFLTSIAALPHKPTESTPESCGIFRRK